MANSERGEVELDVGGQKYLMRFGVNALIEIQRELGVEAEEDLFKKFGEGQRKLETLRTWAWKGIRKADGSQISEDEAGDIIDAVGLLKFPEKLREAVRLSMPEALSGDAGVPGGKADGSPGGAS